MDQVRTGGYADANNGRVLSGCLNHSFKAGEGHIGIGKSLQIYDKMFALETFFVKGFIFRNLVGDGHIIRQALETASGSVTEGAAAGGNASVANLGSYRLPN